MKKIWNSKLLACFIMGFFLLLGIIQTPQAAELSPLIRIGDFAIDSNGKYYLYTAGNADIFSPSPVTALPDGISYDRASNTLTLTNCTIEATKERRVNTSSLWSAPIHYFGTKRLNLVINGNCKLLGRYYDSEHPGSRGYSGAGIALESETKEWKSFTNGGITVSGPGNLSVENCKTLITQYKPLNTPWYLLDDQGEIIFSNINVTGTGRLEGLWNKVTISNSKITLNNKMVPLTASDGTPLTAYGITAGAWADNGKFTVRNSIIEVKGFSHGITCGSYSISGENYYIGKTSAKYSVSAKEFWKNSGDTYDSTDTGYILITTENKNIPPKNPVKVSSLKITGNSAPLLEGKKRTLKVTISPANAANKAIYWYSGNKNYATVSSSGVVTAKAAGAGKTVTIAARSKDGSNIKAYFKIRIKGAVRTITLKAPSSLKAGKSTAITATVKAGAGADKTLLYTSSNSKYATVNSKGVVKANTAGKGKTVTITATAKDGSGKKASIKIKIN